MSCLQIHSYVCLSVGRSVGGLVGGWVGGWVGRWVGGWVGGWLGGWVGGKAGGEVRRLIWYPLTQFNSEAACLAVPSCMFR